ncbi:hypothetical protein ANCCEY_14363 [Ancylostoma ceylanicum]|uniref:Major facilitator superfamily (MFS) profile domain-containing protein n=1 Tax=Ancylostoma ceylanicum TaxID=53326 RepID=A0A0D6LFV6_9BILA|nr:hypothetical protein ANCCEY_14363 [Ancylostoma ceylanicum]
MDSYGQCFFGLLPLFHTGQKWIMMAARLMTGFGAGTLSVLRAYAATASVPRDRLSAVSFGTAGYVLGLSFGPAIQKISVLYAEYALTEKNNPVMIFRIHKLH